MPPLSVSKGGRGPSSTDSASSRIIHTSPPIDLLPFDAQRIPEQVGVAESSLEFVFAVLISSDRIGGWIRDAGGNRNLSPFSLRLLKRIRFVHVGPDLCR